MLDNFEEFSSKSCSQKPFNAYFTTNNLYIFWIEICKTLFIYLLYLVGYAKIEQRKHTHLVCLER